MPAKAKLKSDISEAIHSSASMLHKVGALNKATMRDFDARHLAVPNEIATAQIKQLREANNVSQRSSRAISTRAKARSRNEKPAQIDRAGWR